MSSSSKILAFVLAGGEGRRLRPLTDHHAKPYVQFADGCRIIDFALANLVNSLVTPVYVLAQYKPHSLVEHVRHTWRPAWPVHTLVADAAAPYRGTAHAVSCHIELLERHKPEVVAVFAADHVYRMDVRQMVRFHAARDADVTVAAIPVPVEKASAFGVMAVDKRGTIEAFEEKPVRPRPIPGKPHLAYASMGNYLFRPERLRTLLEQAMEQGGTDFGRNILPALPGSPYRALAYNFAQNTVPGLRPHEERGYWRDVGTVDALDEARRDASGPRPRLDLRNAAWPLRPLVAITPAKTTATFMPERAPSQLSHIGMI